MVYTNRRATAEGEGIAWVHGTDLGVASSKDGGQNWVYRGILPGLDIEWGRNTFWAPEIIWHEDKYHMYVSYIQGVPIKWEGFRRDILHYTSPDLLKLDLYSQSSNLARTGLLTPVSILSQMANFRMWYKDEDNSSYIYAADSPNLYDWQVVGPVLTEQSQEGPNVFRFKGYFWMIVDEWHGLGVYRSGDLQDWERQGLILDRPGTREEDGVIGEHADVVVQAEGNEAYIFYFTHPDRKIEGGSPDRGYTQRRS